MKTTRGNRAAWLAFLIAGCAQPQAVTVTPEVRVDDSNMADGRAVQVSVTDRRASQTLGSVGSYDAGTDLAVRGDLAAILRSSLANGLVRQGFIPTPGPTADARELRVEILSLDYGIADRSALSRHIEAAARLKAACLKNSLPQLERSHGGEVRDAVFLTAQDERSNSRYVSAAVSAAINSLLADRPLMECLAR